VRGLLSAWVLDPQVAIRREPFGGLAYHYGNRRLTFLRAPELVDLVESLDRFDSIDAALEASAIPQHRWPAFTGALEQLKEAGVIRAR
jgi:putative mycofactocin binding protein MftB